MRKCLYMAIAVAAMAGSDWAMAMKIGDTAGAVALTTLDGFPRVMKNYAEHKGTAVVFMSARCDETLAQIARLRTIAALDSDEEDMVCVGIVSNPAESGEEVRTFCQRLGLAFPVYRDPEGKAARHFDATMTTECFLLDKTGTLIFHGDVMGLEAAVKALIADQPLAETATRVSGTPLDQPGVKREVEDLYGSIAFSSELIFTQIPGAPVHHCSTLAEAPNGDLLCLWYGGSYESAEDQVLFLARLKPGERIWSVPEVVVRNADHPPGNAIIFQDPAHRLWMVWGRMEVSRPARRGTGWSDCRLMTRFSTDNGYTWTAEREWPDSLGWLPRNPPITLRSGEMVLPMSLNRGLAEGGILLRLNPDGETWSRLGFMPGGEQMTVIERTDGSLLACARSSPYILSSESSDGGVTWTPPATTALKCPDSANVMIRLRSGRVLLAHNDNDGEDRATLALEQSEDEGRTWKDKKILEMEPNLSAGEYSYPCLVQTVDGMIHISYTCRRYSIKHAAFDEGWLTRVERPN